MEGKQVTKQISNKIEGGFNKRKIIGIIITLLGVAQITIISMAEQAPVLMCNSNFHIFCFLICRTYQECVPVAPFWKTQTFGEIIFYSGFVLIAMGIFIYRYDRKNSRAI